MQITQFVKFCFYSILVQYCVQTEQDCEIILNAYSLLCSITKFLLQLCFLLLMASVYQAVLVPCLHGSILFVCIKIITCRKYICICFNFLTLFCCPHSHVWSSQLPDVLHCTAKEAHKGKTNKFAIFPPVQVSFQFLITSQSFTYRMSLFFIFLNLGGGQVLDVEDCLVIFFNCFL